MKISALLIIVLLVVGVIYLKNKPLGKRVIGHFYFQSIFIVMLLVTLGSKLIHFRLTLMSLFTIVCITSMLYLSLPVYLVKLRQRIRK